MSRRARNIVFTWNNPPTNHVDLLKLHPEIGFIVFQLEKGSNGTEHLQGYIELSKQLRFNVLRKWHPWHIELRRGSQEEAIAYCL